MYHQPEDPGAGGPVGRINGSSFALIGCAVHREASKRLEGANATPDTNRHRPRRRRQRLFETAIALGGIQCEQSEPCERFPSVFACTGHACAGLESLG